jgi:adenylate cyclase class 2
MPSHEVESKYPLADPAAIRRRIESLGAIAHTALHQSDTYFAHPARDFAQTNEAFRLRRVGDENALTYKGPLLDHQTKTREEIEVPIAPGPHAAAQMTALLCALGFRAVRTVDKTRHPFHLSWDGRDFELALDVVCGLGDFLEIETLADAESWPSARDSLLSLASTLGLEHAERRSYLQLILQRDALDAALRSD